VFALGALIGALVAARRINQGLRLLVVTALAFGLFEIATSLMPTYWLFLILLVPTGLTVISLSTAANASVQLNVPAAMRGRVMGIYMLVFLGGTPLGAPLTGWVAQEFGTRMALASGGIISVVATVAVGFAVARVRGVPVRNYLRQARPQFAR
jgi:MFS family permease